MVNYKVGQILFMTSEKSMKIIPVQVVEEVVRTTLDGKEQTYMIMFPNKDKTVGDIAHIKGMLFTSKEEVKSYMIENTEKAINAMIETAEKLKYSVFNVQKENKPKMQEKNMQSNINNNIITVDLGNGVKAKMSTKDLEKVANT